MDLQELHKSLADLSHTIYCTCECVHHGMNIYVFLSNKASIYVIHLDYREHIYCMLYMRSQYSPTRKMFFFLPPRIG